MLTPQDKIKDKLYTAKVKFDMDHHIRRRTFITGVIIVLLILLIIIVTTIFAQNAFVKYNVKSCYDKRSDLQDIPGHVTYAVIGKSIFIHHEYEHVCFSKLDRTHEQNGNRINVYLLPQNLKGDCVCTTEFAAEIGPLADDTYLVSLINKAEGVYYTIDSRNITIE